MLLTKASKLGLYALTEMALEPEAVVSAGILAERCGVSENHIAKVLQQLARGDLVASVRGVGGGYRLLRSPSKITMADVVSCIEGASRDDEGCRECPFRSEKKSCLDAPACNVHGMLGQLQATVFQTFEAVTVASLARGKERS